MAKKRIMEKNKRRQIYKHSSLPFSFEWKIRKAFVGEICPICKFPMELYDYDEIIGNIPSCRKPTIQHNIPISLGGEHELSNISVICHNCNVKIQNKITGELNNEKVVEKWQKLNGLK